jgi:hypothetical protein
LQHHRAIARRLDADGHSRGTARAEREVLGIGAAVHLDDVTGSCRLRGGVDRRVGLSRPDRQHVSAGEPSQQHQRGRTKSTRLHQPIVARFRRALVGRMDIITAHLRSFARLSSDLRATKI